jgi:hypothetical protein
MSVSAWAWTTAETNAVGCALAELTALSSGCDAPLSPDDPAANEPLEEPYPSFSSLFSEDLQIASNWTPDDKRAAFFHYLNSIPDMTAGGVFTGNVWYAKSALGFCRVKGDISVLPCSLGILASTNVHESLGYEASMIFRRFASPSSQMNAFVESVVAQTSALRGAGTRKCIYSDYSNKLGIVYDAGQTNVARIGAAALYHGLSDHVGARPLDALLLRVFPEYAASSNRLRVATLALASDPSEEWTSGYFANITNQLLNAPQPLPTVDGL